MIAVMPKHQPILSGYPAHRPRLVLGLISGTSADGIDAALVRFPAVGQMLPPELIRFSTTPYPEQVRQQVLAAAADRLSVRHLAVLHTELGKLFGQAAVKLMGPEEVDLVASHGQTVCHLPLDKTTLQLGEAAWIAHLTNRVTVSDFRVADLCLNGQGAPLVPLFDAHLLAGDDLRVAVNLGGIANITVIPPSGSGPVEAWDTGPANCVSDALCRLAALRSYDQGGEIAARGQVVESLLQELLQHPYFKTAPPKSTGLEDFGEDFAQALLGRASEADLIRTSLALSAETLAGDLVRAALGFPSAPALEVVFAGGGTSNPVLTQEIASALNRKFEASGLPQPRLRSFSEFGISEDGREAAAFAFLGDRTALGQSGNVPGATGADRSTVLGKISWPSAAPNWACL